MPAFSRLAQIKWLSEPYHDSYATSLMKNVVYYEVEQFFHISPSEYKAMIIFPELIDENLQISQVNVANEITITLRTTLPTAACPWCGTISKRVQSRYRRTLHDLPISGRLVRLIVEVRRFFCKKSTCARKIFAEQLPALCHPHAQRTKRLQEALCRLGLAMGGQAGEDRGCEQGMSGSRDTILRLVRKFELPAAQESRVIGLDDWAWKRRPRYGTLICE